MKSEKRTFVFHLDWADFLSGQPDDVRLSVYDAIIAYVSDGTEPQPGTPVYLVFLYIKQQIDKDAAKYADTCAKRGNAGRQHKGNQYTRRLMQNGINGTSVPNSEQMEQMFQNGTSGTNGTDNDYEYDNDIDNDYVNNNSDIYNGEKNKIAADKSAIKKSIDERKTDFMNQIAAIGLEKYGKEMCRDFFEYWTESNPNGKKMRFEMQKVFDINRRMATWNKNQKNIYHGNKRNDGNVPIERIVAAGRAWADAIR